MTDATQRPVRRALISVSDKNGIIEFAKTLHARGVEILSTGGTAKLLIDNMIIFAGGGMLLGLAIGAALDQQRSKNSS